METFSPVVSRICSKNDIKLMFYAAYISSEMISNVKEQILKVDENSDRLKMFEYFYCPLLIKLLLRMYL